MSLVPPEAEVALVKRRAIAFSKAAQASKALVSGPGITLKPFDKALYDSFPEEERVLVAKPEDGEWFTAHAGDTPVGLVGTIPGDFVQILIKPEHRGKGLTGPIEDTLAKQKNVAKLYATILACNLPSIKAHRKSGFQYISPERRKALLALGKLQPGELRLYKDYPADKQAQYAPGIAEKGRTGNPLEGLTANELVTYVLQHHATQRRPGRPHFDLRLGTPRTGMYSWAIPKAELPKPGEKKLAPITEIHSVEYNDFQGTIGKGYGAGQVRTADKGKALITKVTPNSINFTLAHMKVPVRYSLVKMKTDTGRDWLLIGKPTGEGAPGVGNKLVMQKIDAADTEEAMSKADDVQAKIDGASQIFDVGPQGNLEAYSVNKSVGGQPIVRTEWMGLGGVKLPKTLANTTFRGEGYAVNQKGRPLKFQEISGLLNAGLTKSLEKQKALGVKMKVAPFAIERFKGEPTQLGSDEERAVLEKLMKHLPTDRFELPERAVGQEAGAELLRRIRQGKQPQTEEGVVIRQGPKRMKYVIRPSTTGYLQGTFPGIGKRRFTAGGLLASLTPEGPANIRLGTGFTDDELQDIISNMNKYKGKPVRIEHKGQFGTGLLRAPAYQGFETDKSGAVTQYRPPVAKPTDGAKPVTLTQPPPAVDPKVGLPPPATPQHGAISPPATPSVQGGIPGARNNAADTVGYSKPIRQQPLAVNPDKPIHDSNPTVGPAPKLVPMQEPFVRSLSDQGAANTQSILTKGGQVARAFLNKRIRSAAKQVDTNPTEAQKREGNYQHGHVRLHGMDITIETPKGAMRSGTDKDGKAWSIKMNDHYGYIKRTESEADNQHIDVFIGPKPDSHMVFIVDQHKINNSGFDEHKVMLGYHTSEEAKAAYLSNYQKGWKGFADITALSLGEFKKWIDDGLTNKPVADQFAKWAQAVNPVTEAQQTLAKLQAKKLRYAIGAGFAMRHLKPVKDLDVDVHPEDFDKAVALLKAKVTPAPSGKGRMGTVDGDVPITLFDTAYPEGFGYSDTEAYDTDEYGNKVDPMKRLIAWKKAMGRPKDLADLVLIAKSLQTVQDKTAAPTDAAKHIIEHWSKLKPWHGIDLDGTLATAGEWEGNEYIGRPIRAMVDRVKRWLAKGEHVKIFTARVTGGKDAVKVIQDWCREYFGRVLPVTNVKDPMMIDHWDDRARQVTENEGTKVGSLQ